MLHSSAPRAERLPKWSAKPGDGLDPCAHARAAREVPLGSAALFGLIHLRALVLHRQFARPTRPAGRAWRVPSEAVGFERRGASFLLAIVGVLALSSCGRTDEVGLSADAINSEQGDVPRPGPLEWDMARTSDDQRSVAIDFVGGPEYESSDFCTVRYEATATETDESVTVVVSGLSPPPPSDTSLPIGCAMVGYRRSITVNLSEPLGERSLINAATGAAHPVNVEPWTPPTSTTPTVGSSAAP